MPTLKEKFSGVGVTAGFAMDKFHGELQKIRESENADLTLRDAIKQVWGDDMTPEKFYRDLGVDIRSMENTVQKLLTTADNNRWLLPEIIRDAIRIGLQYTPFYSKLVAGEENINGTGLTMPYIDWRTAATADLQLRDVAESASIPLAQTIVWRQKVVNIHKTARGLSQTYESIQFTPISLATMYFEELGVRLGADLDRSLVNVAINGEQADNSEAAPVMGATTANTLTYLDIARAWVRFKRIFRNSTVMLMSEADALTVLNMDQFLFIQYPGGVSQSGVTLNVNTPLPSSQDIYIHESMTTGQIVFIDVKRFAIQITAQPLLTESDKIISRQINETFVSLITGFAVLFKDGRLVLDYTTSIGANPGPVVVY